MVRCDWARDDPLMIRYHDTEWGVPVHDDRKLFEFLVLDMFQAGLSWAVVLKKREAFRRAFSGFDPSKVAEYGKTELKELLADAGIVRNRRKIEASVGNARALLKVQDDYGNFDEYVWQFTGGRTRLNRWRRSSDIPTKTVESVAMSADLKSYGFKFAGPTICYAFMQSVGLVNDHLVMCFRHREVGREEKAGAQRQQPEARSRSAE